LVPYITQGDISKFGGGGFLQYYNYSLPSALLSTYPEFNWKIWKFNKVSPILEGHSYNEYNKWSLELLRQMIGITIKAHTLAAPNEQKRGG